MTIEDRWNDSDRRKPRGYRNETCASLLGTFAKLQQATISLVLSFRIEQLCCHWKDVNEIWYLNVYLKSIEKIQVSLKTGKNNGYYT